MAEARSPSSMTAGMHASRREQCVQRRSLTVDGSRLHVTMMRIACITSTTRARSFGVNATSQRLRELL